MSFIIDQQTLDDLNIGGKYKAGSVFSLFNTVQSRGGERLLEEFFRSPLTDAAAINERSNTIAFIRSLQLSIPSEIRKTEAVEEYIALRHTQSFVMNAGLVTARKMAWHLLRHTAYPSQQESLAAIVEIFTICRRLAKAITADTGSRLPLHARAESIGKLLDSPRLSRLMHADVSEKPTLYHTIRLHHFIARYLSGQMEEILHFLYHLDVYAAVADTARSAGMTPARALPSPEHVFIARGLRHPCLQQAVGNDLQFDTNRNLLFLTGANMAGKSTLMKAFGINIYIAHLGFPVAADSLVFSVRDGLFSSVNVPDDISRGYSHYYAEVKRVKTVSEAVGKRKNLVVIFDELFKGTNVKDAFDATLAVTEALATYRNSFFLISTHIIEVGECLKERCPNARFVRLPSLLEGNRLRYTYTLEEGITADRHGMRIIEQEGIIGLISPPEKDG